jgi:transcriptional regulator with PAS, ATPase and Fis domain
VLLEEFTEERIGGHERKKVDLRVIAATNQDLMETIEAGPFREPSAFQGVSFN